MFGTKFYIELFEHRDGKKNIRFIPRLFIKVLCGPFAWVISTIDFFAWVFESLNVDKKIDTLLNKIAGKPKY